MEEYVLLNPDGSTEKLWLAEEIDKNVLAKRFLVFDKKTHGKKFWARKLYFKQHCLAYTLMSELFN